MGESCFLFSVPIKIVEICVSKLLLRLIKDHFNLAVISWSGLNEFALLKKFT